MATKLNFLFKKKKKTGVAETTPNGLENLKAFVLKIYLRLAGTPLSSKDEVLRTSFWSVDTSSFIHGSERKRRRKHTKKQSKRRE
jgi:hypothetical protein